MAMTRQEIIQALEQLPEDATLEDAMDQLYLLHKIERGIAQADAGQTIPIEEVRRRVGQWFK